MTGNLFTYEISGRIRVSAHVPPTGRFPNCLVSHLTVCLREKSDAEFPISRSLLKKHASCLRVARTRLKNDRLWTKVFFFFSISMCDVDTHDDLKI